jgi:predicted RNA-binding Zn ribbon-like protein
MTKATVIYHKPVTPPPTVVLEVPLSTAEVLYKLLYAAVAGSGVGRESLNDVWKSLKAAGVELSTEVRFDDCAHIKDV